MLRLAGGGPLLHRIVQSRPRPFGSERVKTCIAAAVRSARLYESASDHWHQGRSSSLPISVSPCAYKASTRPRNELHLPLSPPPSPMPCRHFPHAPRLHTAYVDDQLIATGKISKAAIIGKQGGIWAQSAGYNVSSLCESDDLSRHCFVGRADR